MAYQSRSKSATQAKEETAQMDYTRTEAHQMAYDFSVYLREKVKKFPHYKKFTLQKDIRESILAAKNGINFVGYIHFKDHKRVRKDAMRRLKKLLKAFDAGEVELEVLIVQWEVASAI